MILLDANVVSESMRSHRGPRVVAWPEVQTVSTLYLSTISLAELLLGIASLPVGKRRRVLAATLGDQILNLFESRIVPFDIALRQLMP